MRIGELARSVDVNVETIRYYQRIGLLEVPEKPYGSMRSYNDQDTGRYKSLPVLCSSHTVLSKFAGLNDAQIVNALEGKVEDSKDAAAGDVAKIVVEKRGRIDDDDFNCVRDAGFTPGEISEIVAHVALNIFTNYFNLVARTNIDWPQISVNV